MTSVDELFKKPGLPSAPTKRKFEAPDAQEAYKATKLSHRDSPNGHANGVSIVDAPEDDEDTEAGPELPPEDEEDDRFFDAGVTRDAADALDYLDKQEDGETYQEEKIDPAWLRRLAVSFEKKVSKNAQLRARYEGDPQKFMASEADLDAETKSWSLLSEHPELYLAFAESEALGMLVGLLAHENTDIAIGAIEIVSELLDEDVETEQEQWDALVRALLDADLLDLLMSNLARLDETNESDRSGVYHSMAVMESLASQQFVAERIGREKVLLWLCNRIRTPEKTLGQNKQYAAEVLQVLLQTSPVLRKRLAVDLDGVDLFLQILAAYRKRDPQRDSPEEEYAENIFDALTCVVDEADGKAQFVEAEGVELCLIMLKEGTFSKLRALRLLDHAVGGRGGPATRVCVQVVEVAGLKTLFGMFKKKADSGTVEHLLGIFAALLRLLPGESSARIRTLAKFIPENVTKLVQLRHEYARKVGLIDQEIRQEQSALSPEEAEDRADEWFSRRLDGGLFCLQTIDTILAWLVAEEPDAARVVSKDVGGDAIKGSLQEQLDGLDLGAEADQDTRDMLTTLMGFL